MRKSTLERYWEEEEFKGFFHDLLAESGLERINEYVQHGSTTRLLHSLPVAYYSYRLARFTRLSFHWQELVRGALLHDYFLYDAQDGDPARKGHWTRHPHIAAEKAKQEMDLPHWRGDQPLPHVPAHQQAAQIPGGRGGLFGGQSLLSVRVLPAPPALFQTARHGARTADCNFAPSRDSGGEGLICKRM